MTLFPEAQREGHTEVDAICGNTIPGPNHFRDFRYIRAIMKESLRCQSLIIPHLRLDSVI